MSATFVLMLFTVVISIFGISHLNQSDADKASLAQRPLLYQKFVQFCRVAWMVMALASVLLFACQSFGGRDCDYDSRGEHCSPF